VVGPSSIAYRHCRSTTGACQRGLSLAPPMRTSFAGVGWIRHIRVPSVEALHGSPKLGGNTLYTKWANEHESNRVACNAARARTILELSQPLQQSHVIDDLEAWLARRRLPAAIAEIQPTHVRGDFAAAASANFRRRRRLDSSHSSNSCPPLLELATVAKLEHSVQELGE
jgi:hypothetical protein